MLHHYAKPAQLWFSVYGKGNPIMMNSSQVIEVRDAESCIKIHRIITMLMGNEIF
jgi:hypothetical protein